MNAILMKTTEEYIVETEEQAASFIDTQKDLQSKENFELIKYESTLKVKKQKGEIVDSFYMVKLTKKFGER